MQLWRKPLAALTVKEKNIGFGYLIFQVALLPTLLQLLGGAFSFPISDALYNFLYFSINFISVLAIFSNFLKKSLLRARQYHSQLLAAVITGFLLYWLCSTLLSVIMGTLFPDFVNLNDSGIVAVLGDHPLALFLGTVLLAPVTEEVLHRGLVFGTLHQKNPLVAYALSALLFAAIHVVQYVGIYSPAHVVLALMQYLPAGLIFAWSYQRCGCILAPIAIHAANNFLAVCIRTL